MFVCINQCVQESALQPLFALSDKFFLSVLSNYFLIGKNHLWYTKYKPLLWLVQLKVFIIAFIMDSLWVYWEIKLELIIGKKISITGQSPYTFQHASCLAESSILKNHTPKTKLLIISVDAGAKIASGRGIGNYYYFITGGGLWHCDMT